MKKITLIVSVLFLCVTAFAQTKEVVAVKTVLRNYHDAMQKLDAKGTEQLFTADSKIYESGGVEGTYVHYLEHHLGPELKVFKSFLHLPPKLLFVPLF